MKRNIFAFEDEAICPYCHVDVLDGEFGGLYDPGDSVTIKCSNCKKKYELTVLDIIYQYRTYQLVGKPSKDQIECPGQLYFDFLLKS